MKDVFSFALRDSTVGILGLGLMGGSLAMRLRGQCKRLIGLDSHLPTLELALSKNIIDQAESDSGTFLAKIDLLIIAVPVTSILNLIQQLPTFIHQPCIIMDIGSTKRVILQAMSALPEYFDVIGGHPLCGKEKLGLENAGENLYQNAPFIITPLERTTDRAKSAAQQIISAIGANGIAMTAEEHDCIVSKTSHLPFLLAASLAHSTPHEYSSFVGPGFRSTSRLAGTPSHMMMGILRSNRDYVLGAIQNFRTSLDEIESALQTENFPELENLLDRSRNSYQLVIG